MRVSQNLKVKFLAQVAITVTLIVSLIFGTSYYSAEAAKKIKSKSVKLDITSVTLETGNIITLSAYMSPTNSTDSIKWSSSNKKVATVNKYGVVTAISEGKADITAKTSSNKKAKCTVTVKKALTTEEVTNLIKTTTVSEETIKQLIASNTISKEEVKKIVNENSLTEEQVNALIDRKLKELNLNSSGGEDVEWVDGTTLEIVEPLPYKSDSVSINDITITKEHSNERRNGVYQKYKYIITVQGEYAPGKNSLYFDIAYYNNKNCENRYYDLNTSNNCVIESYTVDENNKFTVVISQYNMNVDYDSFSVSNPSASYSMTFDADWEDGSTINVSDLSDSNYDSFSITRYHFDDYVDGKFYKFKYDFNVSGTARVVGNRIRIYCNVLGYADQEDGDGSAESVGSSFEFTDLNLDENNKFSKSFTVYSNVNIDGDLSVTY